MHNRYTCPLQPCTHWTLKLLIQGHPHSAEVTHIADFKSAYISHIIGPRGLQCETNLIMWCESSDVVRFDLGPLLQGQTRRAKVLITCLLSVLEVLEVWDGKPTYRKSWVGNLFVWSDLTLGPSFKVKRGQANLKLLTTRLLLVLKVWDGKPTYRKSWPWNLLMWSDLTLDPLFKVK